MAHDGVARGHPLHAERQDRRHHRRQTFGHRGDRQRHPEDQHVEDRRESLHVLDQQDGCDHHHRDGDDDDPQYIADPVELVLQRGPVLPLLPEEVCDPSHLRLHARRGDHAAAVSVGRGGAAEDHVHPVAQGRLRADRGGVLHHRQTLAGQCRLRRLQRRRRNQPGIGGDGVPLLDHDDVARHQFRRRDGLPRTVADDLGLRCRHPAQRGHGPFGPRLLEIAHRPVEEDDRKDRDRLVGKGGLALEQPEDRRYAACGNQQDHQHIGELVKELAPFRDLLSGRQLVSPMTAKPPPNLLLAEAGMFVAGESRENLVDALPMELDLRRIFGVVAHQGTHGM